MSYKTISKYLFFDTKKTKAKDPIWFYKRSTFAITGWLTKNNEWIQGTHFHAYPFCIHKMEPDLEPEYTEAADVQILSLENQKTSKSKKTLHKLLSIQQLKAYKCIERGNVRVIELEGTVFFTANSLERLNKSLKIIQNMFGEKLHSKRFTVSDILNSEGELQATAEYDPEENLYKINWKKF